MSPDLSLEKSLWSSGLTYIAGLDEAGRGPWAGPVSAGAVILSPDSKIDPKVRDSKKMSKKNREDLFEEIKENCLGWGIGLTSAEEIDQLGIQQSVKKAMQSALYQAEKMIGQRAEYLIIDGANVLNLDGYQFQKLNKGDGKHYSIAAASILAKVERDRIMEQYALQYPQYGFESHMGYGTKAHLAALHKFGITPIHRKSFKPVKKVVLNLQ